jgi:hypothetical protein
MFRLFIREVQGMMTAVVSASMSLLCNYRQALVAGFPPRRPGFKPRSGDVGFMVDKVTLVQVFSEYFGFPCQVSFHQLLHIHHHLSSGAGTIGRLVADVPSGFSLTLPQESIYKKKKLNKTIITGNVFVDNEYDVA